MLSSLEKKMSSIISEHTSKNKKNMRDILKYPRTQHLRGSRFQHGDHDLESVQWEELAGKHLVIEEKVDGSNCGVSFDESGKLLLQSRGHYLRGGPREKQFELLKQWANTHAGRLRDALDVCYIMYAEWCYAKHTMYYDALPHYFMEFDIMDCATGEFMSTERRREFIKANDLPVTSVRVIASGQFQYLSELSSLVTRSAFVTDKREDNLRSVANIAGVTWEDVVKHTDPLLTMEGLYVKWEENGVVKGRYKFVRDSFTSKILDSEQHWHDRPIIQNSLVDGALERMFIT